MKHINTYDIDGVICLGDSGFTGVWPGPDDVIITGRSVEEARSTYSMLRKRGIWNEIRFNPLPFKDKTRESSGVHKGKTILNLQSQGITVDVHFEDDEIQAKEILKLVPTVKIVLLVHELTDKENKLRNEG